MNKLQASQYLYAKGPGSKVEDYKGQIWTLREDGGVDGESHSDYYGLPTYLAPFSIIEPEKSNEELAKEAVDIWSKYGTSSDSMKNMIKFNFDVMDQKIKQTQSVRNEGAK